MAKTVHYRLPEQRWTTCGFSPSQFPRLRTSTDLARVDCQNCLDEVERRKRREAQNGDDLLAAIREAIDAIRNIATEQASKKDIAELKLDVESMVRQAVAEQIDGKLFPRYMNKAECASYINRTPTAVRRLVDRGNIPHIKIGRKIQFDRERIDRWMARHGKRGALLL